MLFIEPLDELIFKVTLRIIITVSGAYFIFTILPVLYQQSPFWTPLSWFPLTLLRKVTTAIDRVRFVNPDTSPASVQVRKWSVRTIFQTTRRQLFKYTPDPPWESVASNIERLSTQEPYASGRLYHALKWLLDTTADDIKLEVVDAIIAAIPEKLKVWTNRDSTIISRLFLQSSLGYRFRNVFSAVHTQIGPPHQETRALLCLKLQRVFATDWQLIINDQSVDDFEAFYLPTYNANCCIATRLLQHDSSPQVACHATCTLVVVAASWITTAMDRNTGGLCELLNVYCACIPYTTATIFLGAKFASY